MGIMYLDESIRFPSHEIFFSRFRPGRSKLLPIPTPNPIDFGFFYAQFCAKKCRFDPKLCRFGPARSRFGLFLPRFLPPKTYFHTQKPSINQNSPQFSTSNRPNFSWNQAKKIRNRPKNYLKSTCFFLKSAKKKSKSTEIFPKSAQKKPISRQNVPLF